MKRKTTIKDIADRTGTSVASVHRALHGMDGVGEALRQSILEEVSRSNYQMNESAALLRRGNVNIVVLLPKIEGNERFYYQGIWQGIQEGIEEIAKYNANVEVIETEYGINGMADALEELFDSVGERSRKIDGLVTCCDDEGARIWITRILREGISVALIDHSMQVDGITCCVGTNAYDIGRISMELADLYRNRKKQDPLLLLVGSRNRNSNKEYIVGVREKAAELFGKGEMPEIIELDAGTEERARESLLTYLKDRTAGAVLASGSRTTFWACDEVKKFFGEQGEADGKICPPVIGLDVFREQGEFFEAGILKASIYQSHTQFGRICLRYLFDRLVNPGVEENRIFWQPISVVMRDNYKYFI